MKFVKDTESTGIAQEILEKETREIIVAVAFWGGDAPKLLNISDWKAETIRIVCDATSGACNPTALRFLHEKFAGRFYTNDRLHAKVYWTPKQALITSANASASGLSLEGAETEGNLEAGVLVDEAFLLADIKKWLEDVISNPETVQVDKDVLKIAQKIWDKRRNGRRTQVSSFSSALKNRAALEDTNIFIAHYHDTGRSVDGAARHRQFQRDGLEAANPPVAIGLDVRFLELDDYEFNSVDDIKDYWQKWIIDLNYADPLIWYFPDDKYVVQNKKTVSVPVFGADQLPVGVPSIPILKADIVELRRRWKLKIGKKADRLYPLSALAD